MGVNLVGAGGHAREIYYLSHEFGIEVNTFSEENPTKKHLEGRPVKDIKDISKDEPCILAVGTPNRKRLVELIGPNPIWYNHIAKSAIFESRHTNLSSKGICIFPNCFVSGNIELGKFVYINTGAQVHHDCVLGDFVSVGPRAVLCGNITVGDNTYIGAGATIKNGVTIGKNVIVGMGAVVISNLLDGTVYAGNPAKIINTKSGDAKL